MEDRLSYEDGLSVSQQDKMVTNIVGVLEKKRDEAVTDRSETESRWLRDIQQFEGNSLDILTKGDTQHGKATMKQRPVVHITRTRTLSIAARIINMLVPSNERSWDIEPTPVPALSAMAQDETPLPPQGDGPPPMVPDMPPGEGGNGMGGPPQMGPGGEPPPMRPATPADLARQEMEQAETRANRMRDHMDDQLAEGRYNAEQRKIIIDGCKLGTGILEGPVVAGQFKKVRREVEPGVWVTEMVDEPAPQYRCIDPWTFYPMPAENIERCEGVFIDRLMSRSELQELATMPGFDVDVIREILREKPYHSEEYSSALVQRANIVGETLKTDSKYGVWKFVGSLDADDLESLGIEVDEETDLVDPMVEAWFCQTRLLKIKRHSLEGTRRLPYYVWNYEENENSIFGYGVPYLMRDSDRVIQATWHMILHNAALNAGAQIVRRKTAVEPADGTEEITGGLKQWLLTDPEMTVNDAFGMFRFECRIDELGQVHDKARQNADEELGFPLIAQGEPTEAVPTHSGMALLMNAANVVQRRIAQNYDDNIIEPSVGALYDWNMTYLDDNEAKGDMTIRAYGATKLVVKDMQAQHLMLIADITTNDRFAPLMDDAELLRGILKAAEVDADQYMLSEEELQNRGPSEREMLEMEKMKAEIMNLQAEAATKGQQPGGMTEADMADLQYRYDRMEADLQIAQMKLEEAALEASKSEAIKLEDIQARFQLGVRADETKRMIASMQEQRKQVMEAYQARLKAEEIRQQRQNINMGFDTFG